MTKLKIKKVMEKIYFTDEKEPELVYPVKSGEITIHAESVEFDCRFAFETKEKKEVFVTKLIDFLEGEL